jgi:uncharacterized protein (DUF2235 family)
MGQDNWKNIVLCSDGTGNQDIKARGTNVFKLYEAVDIQGHKIDNQLRPQVAFYDDGVGTANAFAKVIGGAFGWGFSHNVKKLYRELVNVYQAGDRIFLFGFSRGAYTVRALAGFIQYCGVIDRDSEEYRENRDALTGQIAKNWEAFTKAAFKYQKAEKRRSNIPAPETREAVISRRKKYSAVNPEEPIHIEFIGVWDTVGAIGAPFDGLRDFISRFHPMWFADNTLGPEVKYARHALALDEERRTFHPELWNERGGDDKRIKQVWFSGVHSNVGGGYPKQGISLVTLDWMMNEAKEAGLRMTKQLDEAPLRFVDEDLAFVKLHQDVHDNLYDSRSGIHVYYRWMPRDITQLCKEHKIPVPKVHISVFERIANGTNGKNGVDSYSPGNIPFNVQVDNSGSISNWPTNPAALAGIPTMMQNYKEPGSKESLLADMSKEVLLGKGSYYAFLALTALAVGFAGKLACSGTGKVQQREWQERRKHKGSVEERGGNALPAAFGGGLLLGLAAIGIHQWADRVDCALCNKYTKYWHNCHRDLRNLLYTTEERRERP